MRIDDPLGDRESEPAAAVLAGARLVRAVETFEDMREIARRDPLTGVGHRDLCAAVLANHPHRHLPTRRRMRQGVVDKDQQELTDANQVGVDAHPAIQVGTELHTPFVRQGRRLCDQAFDHLVELDRPGIEAELPGIGQGERRQIADDAVELFNFLDDALPIGARLPI